MELLSDADIRSMIDDIPRRSSRETPYRALQQVRADRRASPDGGSITCRDVPAAPTLFDSIRARHNPLVVQMTQSSSVSLSRSPFDAFLFAPIGGDSDAMPLSLLSTLARLDVDPWQEAAELALLPVDAATKRLASLIATLPDGRLAQLDPQAIAARVIRLLPRPARATTPPPATASGNGATVSSAAKSANARAVTVFVIFIALLLGAEVITANLEPPAPADTGLASSAASTVSSRPGPPISGQ